MVCLLDNSDSDSDLTIHDSFTSCSEQLAGVDSLREKDASAAESGRIVRQLAQYPVDWQPNRGSDSIADLSFSAMLDLDARLTEIGPARDTELHRHSYEALFYVIAGAGYSTISVEAGETHRIDWQAGDLFATPRAAWHQHANGSSSEPARLLEVTTAPLTKAWATHWLEKPEQEITMSNNKLCEPESCT